MDDETQALQKVDPEPTYARSTFHLWQSDFHITCHDNALRRIVEMSYPQHRVPPPLLGPRITEWDQVMAMVSWVE